MSALLRESVLRERTPRRSRVTSRAWWPVGLWPPERDLIEEMLTVARDEIAGFYVPESRVLYVVDGFRVPFSVRFRVRAAAPRRAARAGAIARARAPAPASRRAGAVRFSIRWMEQDDATTAVQAALEGDATRYGYAASRRHRPARCPIPNSCATRSRPKPRRKTKGALAEAPALLRLTLTLPYARGYPLSLAEGTELLDDPPATTEQVIHAERRRADFEVAADLAPLEAASAARLREPRAEHARRAGRLGAARRISAALRSRPPPAMAGTATATWRRAAANRLAFVWWTAWDSERDAVEFADAYAGIASAVQARAGLTAPPRAVRDGTRVLDRERTARAAASTDRRAGAPGAHPHARFAAERTSAWHRHSPEHWRRRGGWAASSHRYSAFASTRLQRHSCCNPTQRAIPPPPLFHRAAAPRP